MSVTWFNPVMYKFISSDGIRALISLRRKAFDFQRYEGVANRYRQAMDSPEPTMVWGRENSQT